MLVVVDASVALKWIFRDADREADLALALGLLDAIRSGRVEVIQPIHWLAEVAAVVARLAPGMASRAIGLLAAAEFTVLDGSEVYLRACEIGAELRAHVFDTLYHAVALEVPDAQLVTADERYYRKGVRLGRITRLRQLALPPN